MVAALEGGFDPMTPNVIGNELPCPAYLRPLLGIKMLLLGENASHSLDIFELI